jgi:hypothetical protein
LLTTHPLISETDLVRNSLGIPSRENSPCHANENIKYIVCWTVRIEKSAAC